MLRLSERCRTALVWDPEACGKRSLCACFFDSETGRMKCCTLCGPSIVIIRVTESSALLTRARALLFACKIEYFFQ